MSLYSKQRQMSHFSGSDVPECYKCYDNFEKILMCQVQKNSKEKFLNLEISDQINYIFKCFSTVTTHQFLTCFVRSLSKFSNTEKMLLIMP